MLENECPGCYGTKDHPILTNWNGPICTNPYHPKEAIEKAQASYDEWKRNQVRV